MKVYLLIESYGDLGDYHEYVHSIYLNLDKAESVKAELDYVANKISKCAECVCSGYCIPNCDCEDNADDCDELCIQYAKDNCDNADPYINKWTQDDEEDQKLECRNKLGRYSGDNSYRIEEKEVVE